MRRTDYDKRISTEEKKKMVLQLHVEDAGGNLAQKECAGTERACLQKKRTPTTARSKLLRFGCEASIKTETF
ncbi:MAG: hypothetical protein K2N95_10290 [Lachnospiraceae bacterium]|nr:hypothetical protein [Lachnospiraceae bacterium]